MKKINHSQSVKTYIVFLDLPIDVSSKIDLIKKKYDLKSIKNWCAHFTLKYEEKLLPCNKEKLFEILNEFAQHQNPIKLEIGDLKINKQKNVGWNIYLEIKNSEIKEIVRDLSQKIVANSATKSESDQWERSNKYYPHISIKGGKDFKNSTKYFIQIKTENLNFPNPIVCNTATLACWENDRWKKVRTFKLSGIAK